MKISIRSLSFWIFVGMLLGVLAGWYAYENIESNLQANEAVQHSYDAKLKAACPKHLDTRVHEFVAAKFSIWSKIFLSLIKVIVAPLVFSLLLVGMAKVGDFKAVGRIGGKTLLYFTFATLLALSLGLLIVNIVEPGKSLDIAHACGKIVEPTPFNLEKFVMGIFPHNIIEAMSKNEILPIIVFTILFAAGTAALKEKGEIIIKFFDAIAHVMLKVTGYVMYVAPLAVFGAVAAVITKFGLGVLGGYVSLILSFLGGLIIFMFVILPLICFFLRINVWKLYRLILPPMSIAFGTASSEAAMPKTIEALEKFGCSNRIIGFVLPLGYSFNLDGSIMYMTFATVAMAQAYHIDLSFGQQITMLLMLLVSSKGLAGVPRASLVVIAGMMAAFNIPEEGLSIILAVDWLLDMGRSATNVAGNAVATAVVSRWEGELKTT